MKRITPLLAAILLGLLVAVPGVNASSCTGPSHTPTLSLGGASPGTGTTSTAITFTVRYADDTRCPATAVSVTISGVGTLALSPAGTPSGTDWYRGVTFSRTLKLPLGTHTYSFAATSGSGAGLQSISFTAVSPAAVVITAPAPPPTPVPTPLPTPVPTLVPTPLPVRTSAPAPRPPAAATPTPAVAAATPTTAPSAPATAQPSGSPAATASAAASSSPAPVALVPGAVASGDGRGVGPVEGPGASPAGSPRPPAGWLGAALAATMAGLAVFFVLARRRSSPEHGGAAMAPALVVATEAGPAAAVAAIATREAAVDHGRSIDHVTPLPPMRDLIPPVDRNLLGEPAEAPAPRPEEAGIPRWLRPSVRAARQGDLTPRSRNWN